MDIEDRAAKWAREYSDNHKSADVEGYSIEDLIVAYLAGSAQTQKDYAHG